MITQLDFITGSAKKCAEIARILVDIEVQQVLIDLPEIQEIDPRIIIRAKLAEALKHQPHGNFIIEDTSFYLEATPGLPGPLVKWFLETIGPKGIAHMALVHGDTKAVAKAIIGYCDAAKEIYFFEGEVTGTVVIPRLENGFGWDLIFVPEDHTETFAEMSEEKKNTMSHRGKAAEKLAEFLHNEKI